MHVEKTRRNLFTWVHCQIRAYWGYFFVFIRFKYIQWEDFPSVNFVNASIIQWATTPILTTWIVSYSTISCDDYEDNYPKWISHFTLTKVPDEEDEGPVIISLELVVNIWPMSIFPSSWWWMWMSQFNVEHLFEGSIFVSL